jgi:high affinity sulfate transporter 1
LTRAAEQSDAAAEAAAEQPRSPPEGPRRPRVFAPWGRGYRREWLRADVVAGVIVWSIVVPQAVAYAQIAGLSPQAGLVAAPGALIGYALLGTSRTLVVGATTSTAALSAAAIGPLAHGDTTRFAALSAALALVTAGVLVGSGLLGLGSVADFISKPVMTGFLFGLGLTIAVGQLPKVLGVDDPGGDFFPRLWGLLGELDTIDVATAAVGVASIVMLVALRRLAPAVPGILVVLVLAIVVSAALDLKGHGVDVVGALPSAFPDPTVPDVSGRDLADLLPTAFGVMLLCTEGLGVARGLATRYRYTVDASRELVAYGGSNLLAGLSQGFVQAGGASQTAAADRAGGKTQLASLVAAGLVLLTGAFLAPLFEDLPQATLGAIVVVAVAGFWRVDELRRFARLRQSAIVLSLLAIAGVLVLGVLPGLIVTAGLSLVIVIKRLSRPPVGALAREAATGAWGRTDRHPDWATTPGVVVIRPDAPLFYANVVAVKERVLAEARTADPRPAAVVLDIAQSPELDVETVDVLGELADALGAEGSELRLAEVRVPVLGILGRSGLADRVTIAPTLDAAIAAGPHHPPG